MALADRMSLHASRKRIEMPRADTRSCLREILRTWAVVLCGLAVSISNAQQDSIETFGVLPEVTVTSTPTLLAPETRQLTFSDSNTSTSGYSTIAQLVSNASEIYVRNYGPGSSATISLRGASSSQTSFTWNGIPIVHGMLGLQDLSVLPTRMFETVQVKFGGTSANSGNGSIGGSVALDNAGHPTLGVKAEIESTLGSFGRYDQFAGFTLGFDRFALRTRVTHAQAENDFPYQPAGNQPERTQENARFEQTGIMQELFYRPADNHQLTARIWWQSTDRRLPPTTVQAESTASQLDKSLRTQLGWSSWRGNWKWNADLSYIQDSIIYRDPTIRLVSPSKSTQYFARAAGTWSIDPSYSITGTVTHAYLRGVADSYDIGQNRSTLSMSYSYKKQRFGTTIDLRQELVDGALAPFSFAIGAQWDAFKWLALHGKVTRDYRLPGLNDLFWTPGGNPELKAEQSWGQELSLRSRLFQSEELEVTITGFNRYVDNWILWSIAPGEAFWSAKNIAEVHSRGLEAGVAWQHQINALQISTAINYSLTKSTNEVEIELPMTSPGTQLVYTPLHTGNANIMLSYKGIDMGYTHNVTGEVRVGLDNYIDGFQTGRVELGYTRSVDALSFKPFVVVDNLWNEQYRVIQYRPMPGRNWAVGVKINYL